MTNDEKAKEISQQWYGCGKQQQITAYEAAIEAMAWKDEQFQKVLDYAENCYGVFSFEQRENFINHIKEIFYGKE